MRRGASDRLPGSLLPADDGDQATAGSMSLIDIAPTLLALVGERSGRTMRGPGVWRRRVEIVAPAAAAS
jgi:hypothetical protein